MATRWIPLVLSVAILHLLPAGAIAQAPAEPPAQSPGAPPLEPTVRLAVPLVGNVTAGGTGTFSGTFTLERFAEQSGQIVAIGMISGIVATTNGVAGSMLQGPVALPVAVRPGNVAASVSFGPPAPVGAATNGLALAQTPQPCAPLHLEVGAVNLNALGLTVTTSPIVLDISGDGDATGALGALVCQVPGTASNAPGLVALLNQILFVLGA